jgi:hypothetical protein
METKKLGSSKTKFAMDEINTAAQSAFNKSLKPTDPVMVISNLLDKSLNTKRPFVKTKFATDPINAYVESVFNIKLTTDNPVHPIDEFYEALILESNTRQPFAKPSRPLDMVNAMTGNYFASSSPSVKSKEKATEVLNKVKEIYTANSKTKKATDEVNNIFTSTAFKFGQPKHSLGDVTDLIKKSLGPGFQDIEFTGAFDIINDISAIQMGNEPPSAKALNNAKTRLLAATYELSDKIHPGSEAYHKKEQEISTLKNTISKLQNNLDQLDMSSAAPRTESQRSSQAQG